MKLLWIGAGVVAISCAVAGEVAVRTALERPVQSPESASRVRLLPEFFAAEVAFPPAEVTLAYFRDAGSLEVYARSGAEPWRRVISYPVLNGVGIRDGVHTVRSVDAAGPRVSLRTESGEAGELALPPTAARDLGTLAAEAGAGRIRLIVSAVDLRAAADSDDRQSALRAELSTLPVPDAPQPRVVRRSNRRATGSPS